MSKPIYQFSERAKKIFLALRQAFITEPEDFSIQNRDEELLERILILIREFPKTFRWGFMFGVYFFDRVTLFFGFGFRRFIHLKIGDQQRYVEKWLNSRFYFIRNLIAGLRGIVMITYFSHHDVWKYIGYDPVTHAQERIKLRQEILARDDSRSTIDKVSEDEVR